MATGMQLIVGVGAVGALLLYLRKRHMATSNTTETTDDGNLVPQSQNVVLQNQMELEERARNGDGDAYWELYNVYDVDEVIQSQDRATGDPVNIYADAGKYS